MAVYTPVLAEDLSRLLQRYDLGELISLQGIDGGIENTNYFVSLNQAGQVREYVLTLFEELSADEVPFFVELGQWLAARDIPVPYAIKDQHGIALQQLSGKPCVLQPRFFGQDLPVEAIDVSACQQIGEALAKLHLAGADFYLQRQAHRGVFWWRRESERVYSRLSHEDAELLRDEVQAFDQLRSAQWDLPMGIIHGDLFSDNALFADQQLVAILDLYNAATAYWLYDLAIVANDWCRTTQGQIDPLRERALIQGYAAVRPFTADEQRAWPRLTRTAAMRFWLSRLIPWLGLEQASRQGASMKLKDPEAYRQILLSRIRTPAQLC
ncbi:homoserine kinase [Nitrincola tapanii]|uniref:Homoserine kinase n=1 Tax=Nitrincola tapanii TaxID=1708751 RepID=A0A5A9W0R1_9GAMM|nr:homoserine kinase [Nitrincola tapanii]KAA0873708.1 homoserine kinase [Nitrincola tapanii]